jgi:hypothetical protein
MEVFVAYKFGGTLEFRDRLEFFSTYEDAKEFAMDYNNYSDGLTEYVYRVFSSSIFYGLLKEFKEEFKEEVGSFVINQF